MSVQNLLDAVRYEERWGTLPEGYYYDNKNELCWVAGAPAINLELDPNEAPEAKAQGATETDENGLRRQCFYCGEDPRKCPHGEVECAYGMVCDGPAEYLIAGKPYCLAHAQTVARGSSFEGEVREAPPLRKWWISWLNDPEGPGLSPLEVPHRGEWPTWVTGFDGKHDTICAAVVAIDEEEAKGLVREAYESDVEPDFRFVEARPDDWSPYAPRFPERKEMYWPEDLEAYQRDREEAGAPPAVEEEPEEAPASPAAPALEDMSEDALLEELERRRKEREQAG